MNTITRRHLLLTTAIVPVAACAQFDAAVQKIPGLASDADLIARGLQTILPTIETLTGLAGGAKAEVIKLIGLAQGAAGQIIGAAGAGTADMVRTIASAVSGIAGFVFGVPGLPVIVSTVVNAALALVPMIEQEVGISPPPGRRLASTMAPEQGRRTLMAVVSR